MLFISIQHPQQSSPHHLSAKNAYEMLPLFKEALEQAGLKKRRGDITKHDLDMVLSTETCDRHLSSFQRDVKKLTQVHRVPHRTYKGKLMTLHLSGGAPVPSTTD
jgi:hypothetical protein